MIFSFGGSWTLASRILGCVERLAYHFLHFNVIIKYWWSNQMAKNLISDYSTDGDRKTKFGRLEGYPTPNQARPWSDQGSNLIIDLSACDQRENKLGGRVGDLRPNKAHTWASSAMGFQFGGHLKIANLHRKAKSSSVVCLPLPHIHVTD